jgi:hypothetical protein
MIVTAQNIEKIEYKLALEELELKICCTCQRELSKDKFCVDRSQKDGLEPRCKECRNKAGREYRATPEGKAYANAAGRKSRLKEKEKSPKGIYVLKQSLKIGKTINLNHRMRQYNVGRVEPYELRVFYEVSKDRESMLETDERDLHSMLAKHLNIPYKETYNVEWDEIKDIVTSFLKERGYTPRLVERNTGCHGGNKYELTEPFLL